MPVATLTQQQRVRSNPQTTPATTTTSTSKTVDAKKQRPIINWFQRKIAGTVRARRASAPSTQVPINGHANSTGNTGTFRTHSNSYSRVNNGRTQQQQKQQQQQQPQQQHSSRQQGTSNDISSNEHFEGSDVDSTRKSSSVAAISMWGNRSNPVEADEDASIRPLPPTSPPSRSPSPSPSRSSSSYLSDPRTFKSIAISTKPTTLLSIDLTTGANGMAHIAQAPGTPSSPPTPTSITSGTVQPSPNASPVHRFPPHIRTSSTGANTSITFSALPPSPQSSRPSSLNPARVSTTGVQAPQHTTPHPRNNPRPSSPPLDNASVLTLASSAFGTAPAARGNAYTWTLIGAGGGGGANSVIGGATYGTDSLSHFGANDSASHFLVDDGLAAEDRDASVRALRPRSSRRGSWDSETSGWSAAVASGGMLARDRSLRTAGSYRTGGRATMDDTYDEGISMTDGDANSTDADVLELDDNVPLGDELLVENDSRQETEPSILVSPSVDDEVLSVSVDTNAEKSDDNDLALSATGIAVDSNDHGLEVQKTPKKAEKELFPHGNNEHELNVVPLPVAENEGSTTVAVVEPKAV